MFKILKSHLLIFLIQVDRMIDHFWRYLTGLPQAKRSLITPNIYLGGQYGVHSVKTLKKLGASAIVNMRTHPIPKELESLGIRSLHLSTPDKTAPTISQLKKGAKFIETEVKNGGKVYIHCLFGEERGATMTIAYLISTGLTYDDAFQLVKKVRTFISPVPLQIARLKEFEKIVSK
jgi:protein-tyrosine phosphatase